MKAVCLNLPHRTDRRMLAEREFTKAGLTVEFIEPVPRENPYISFNHSMKMILESITEPTMVFEDDVEFINLDKWDNVFSMIPKGWDLLYLGGNVRTRVPKINDHWFKCMDTWTTHAIIYTPEAAKRIVELFEPDGLIYDEQLRTKVQPVMNCFICKPFLAIQRPSHSDIWNTWADYGILHTQNNLR